jgi:hypothetical protein
MSDIGSKTIILYAHSGIGKSLNAKFFALYMYRRYKRPVMLVSAEGSSRQHFLPLVKLGIVIPLWLGIRSSNSAMRKLRKGLWPAPAKNAEGKDVMVWIPIPFALDAAGYDRRPCGYIFEGITSISEMCLKSNADEGRLQREQKGDAFEEEGETFVPSSKTGYNIVQDEMQFAIRDMDTLPVERILWTAHEHVGEEAGTGRTMYGPGLVGKAKTASVQKYCATLLHLDAYTTRVEVTDPVTGETFPAERTLRRIWFQPHLDPVTNCLYPAKLTTEMGPYFTRYPGGFFSPTEHEGLDKFLEFEESVNVDQLGELKKWKDKIDGVKETNDVTTG